MLQRIKNKIYSRIIDGDEELRKLRDEYRTSHGTISTLLYTLNKKSQDRGG